MDHHDWSLKKDDIVYGPSSELLTLSDLQYSKISKTYEEMFSTVDIAVPRYYKQLKKFALFALSICSH